MPKATAKDWASFKREAQGRMRDKDAKGYDKAFYRWFRSKARAQVAGASHKHGKGVSW